MDGTADGSLLVASNRASRVLESGALVASRDAALRPGLALSSNDVVQQSSSIGTENLICIAI